MTPDSRTIDYCIVFVK